MEKGGNLLSHLGHGPTMSRVQGEPPSKVQHFLGEEAPEDKDKREKRN